MFSGIYNEIVMVFIAAPPDFSRQSTPVGRLNCLIESDSNPFPPFIFFLFRTLAAL